MSPNGGSRALSLLKRVLLGGFPIGLVITLALAHSPLIPPTPHAIAPTMVPTFIPAQLAAQANAEEQDRLQAIAWNAEYAQYLANVAAEAAAAAQKASRPAVTAVQAPQTPVASARSIPDGWGCGGVNLYAAYIYYRESGCNPGALNGAGCAGIGQACPGSKLPCSLTDFACQDAYFTDYALARYGSWEAAYYFWIGHGWW